LEEPSAGTRLATGQGARPRVPLDPSGSRVPHRSPSIDEFVSAILALLALSVVIAALGIVNTLGLSVIERTRALGLLRAVGLDRGQVRHMIRYESLIIAVFGALLGLGLGVLYGSALQQASAADGMAVLSIPFRQLGLYLLAGIAIGVAAAIWPARRAARVRILQAISPE